MNTSGDIALHIVRHGDVVITATDGRKNSHRPDTSISALGRRQMWEIADSVAVQLDHASRRTTPIFSSYAVRCMESAIQMASRLAGADRLSLLPSDISKYKAERRKVREQEQGIDFLAIPFATLPNEPVLRRKLEVQQEEIREELDALAIGVQPDYRLADFLAPPIEYEGVPLDIWQKTNKQLRLPKESIERIFDFKDEILASLAKGVRVSGSRIDCFVVTHENVAELLIASFMSDFDPMSATVDDLNHLAHLSRGEGITVWLNKYGKVLEKERIKPSSFYATDVV